MKKKVQGMFLLFLMTLTFTGCVKFNANMDIKKDKSMDFSIIYAIDASMLEDEQIVDEDEKKQLESEGFTITDYSKDNMKGFTISKKIDNIDTVSSTEDAEYSLTGILDEEVENKYIFKVKKGIFKNTYTAKLKFDASDNDLDMQNDENMENNDETQDNEEDDFPFDLDNEDSNDEIDNDFSSDFDFSNMNMNLDLSFNVTLPYSAKSNNASTSNDKDKSLTWNLTAQNASTIEFEFELYNRTNLYIGIACIALLIIVIIVVIIKKGSKKSKNTPVVSTTEQNQPENKTEETLHSSEQQ